MRYLILAALLPAVALAQSPYPYQGPPIKNAPQIILGDNRPIHELIQSQTQKNYAQREYLIQGATRSRIEGKILTGEKPLDYQYEELTSRLIEQLSRPKPRK